MSKHGGRRKGAGRPAGPFPVVQHRFRPHHEDHDPMHITLRARRNLPSFRTQRVQALVRSLLRRAREHFQIVHFSIQSNHLHLIVEAEDKAEVASGMNSFASRFAKRLNQILGGRKGKVWDHRYHRRDLTTPTAVKRALVYVLANWKKHGHAARAAPLLDPFSTAAEFNGWSDPWPGDLLVERATGDPATLGWRPPEPKTWLLGLAWRRNGLLSIGAAPALRPGSRDYGRSKT